MRFNFSMCLVFLISFATLLWQPCDAVAQEKKLSPEKLKPAYTVVWTELFKQPELKAEFGITDEQAWTVGLSCGGELEVLIERLD